MEWKFPGMLKSHPTFTSSPLLNAQKSIEQIILLLGRKLCISLKRASIHLKGIFYQMDHIWLANSIHNKSPDLKMGSQWSYTLYHSLIVTLKACPVPPFHLPFTSVSSAIFTHPAWPAVSPPCPRTCRARRVCCRRGPPPPPSRGGKPGRLGRAGGSGDLKKSTINLAIKTNQ